MFKLCKVNTLDRFRVNDSVAVKTDGNVLKKGVVTAIKTAHIDVALDDGSHLQNQDLNDVLKLAPNCNNEHDHIVATWSRNVVPNAVYKGRVIGSNGSLSNILFDNGIRDNNVNQLNIFKIC